MTRKLSTIKEITNIFPIEGADRIELAEINKGWKVIIKKDEYAIGSKVLYIEVDAWVPTALAPFLQKGDKVKRFNNVEGNLLKTIKLKGVLSQGLVLPIEKEYFDNEENLDEFLNIQKFEKLAITSNGVPARNFPPFIPKTDQERCQNLAEKIFSKECFNDVFMGTLKMDGTSCTVYNHNGHIGVCSRNIEIIKGENIYWKAKGVSEITEILKENENLAFQGEIVGVGVQKNKHNIDRPTLYVFDIYDIHKGYYLSPDKYPDYKVNYVPFKLNFTPSESLNSVDKLMDLVKQHSKDEDGNHLEGIVFKRINKDKGRFTFKVINNEYIL